MKMYDHTNGQVVSEIVKDELQRFINKMAKDHPNDQDLGEAIRELRTISWKNYL